MTTASQDAFGTAGTTSNTGASARKGLTAYHGGSNIARKTAKIARNLAPSILVMGGLCRIYRTVKAVGTYRPMLSDWECVETPSGIGYCRKTTPEHTDHELPRGVDLASNRFTVRMADENIFRCHPRTDEKAEWFQCDENGWSMIKEMVDQAVGEEQSTYLTIVPTQADTQVPSETAQQTSELDDVRRI